MALFLSYLRARRRVLLFFALACAIFAVVFTLCELPLGAVAYPALLSALLGCGFLLLDFRRTKRKHEELQRLARLPAALTQELPPPETPEEADYQALLRAFRSELAEREAASGARYQEMVDYYTLWAHQIKTPIASMRLTLQNEETPLSRALQGDLFRIEQYAEMVLAFLRLDADSGDYVFREYALDPILRQAVRRFAREFITRKLSLRYEPVSLTVVTDEKWLSFVLEQLLSNALKYTREGGCVRLYLRAGTQLCVEDTGIGIAPEDLPRIFEKGYTGYNGRADKRASGIGLYLCRRISEKLSIGLSAESKVGKGTTLVLDFAAQLRRRA